MLYMEGQIIDNSKVDLNEKQKYFLTLLRERDRREDACMAAERQLIKNTCAHISEGRREIQREKLLETKRILEKEESESYDKLINFVLQEFRSEDNAYYKIQVLGNKVGNIEECIRAHLKKKGLLSNCDTFRSMRGIRPEDSIPNDEREVIVYTHSGGNEGYYIMIATRKASEVTDYFMFRFHCSLNEVIVVQNELLKILEI